MEINKIYHSIEDGELFHVISKQIKNGKTYLKFKRHNSTFDFIYTPPQDNTLAKYVLLRGKEKAKVGTLRAMWQDYKELREG